MTKPRAPLTFELALTRVAALLGWDGAARVVGKSERAVRNWSDPDVAERIGIDDALALDVAFQAAGGECAPFAECYQLRLEAALVAACANSIEIARRTAHAIKEGGEAHAAFVMAACPGATEAERQIALREGEEAIQALTSTMAAIRAGRTGHAAPGEPA